MKPWRACLPAQRHDFLQDLFGKAAGKNERGVGASSATD